VAKLILINTASSKVSLFGLWSLEEITITDSLAMSLRQTLEESTYWTP